MAQINQAPSHPAAIEGLANVIGKAFDVVHNIYGINTEKQKQALNELAIQKGQGEAALQKENMDPESNVSSAKQSSMLAAIEQIKQKQGKNMSQGQLQALDQLRDRIPNMSGAQLDTFKENSPLEKFYLGQLQAEAQQNKFDVLAEPRKDANLQRANAAYDSVIGKNYEQRLDAANRVEQLINAARNGTLIPTKNLGAQLATDINMLQAGHTSVSGTKEVTPHTLFGKAGEFVHFASGDPQASITPGDLDQMAKENRLLYNELGKQHEQKFKAWIKGQPRSAQGPLQDRFDTAKQQYFPNGPQELAAQQPQPNVGASKAGVGPIPTIDEYFRNKR